MSNCWTAAPFRSGAEEVVEVQGFLWMQWGRGEPTELHDKLVPALRDAIKASRDSGDIYEIVRLTIDDKDFYNYEEEGTAGILIVDGCVYENREDELAGIVEEITDGEEEWE